ncbi:MAG: hypothetical protein PHF42_08830, partial [Pseudomonas sp.]|nr:hypothetical protein [Pseudomonas sp.]
SGTGTPFSACFKTERIWLSVNRDFFMQNLLAYSLWKILLMSTVIFRGDYLFLEKINSSMEIEETNLTLAAVWIFWCNARFYTSCC